MVNCNNRSGFIAGNLHGGALFNCTVKNATIMTGESNPRIRKFGGLVGYFCGYAAENCAVNNITIKAHSEIGGLFGCVNEGIKTIVNCKVENSTLWPTVESDTKTGIYVGRDDYNNTKLIDCSYNNVTIK